MKIIEFAPAKLNLALHVIDQNRAGYHILDSLVAFADVGDLITIERSTATTLEINGPFADSLSVNETNLVLRAAHLYGAACPTRICLTKNLPIASGIGGGSADAAATLRAMSKLWGLPIPVLDAQLALGADVPVCIRAKPQFMRGVGDRLEDVRGLPEMAVVLVNAGYPVATGEIFSTLTSKHNSEMSTYPVGCDQDAFIAWLRCQRNDLEKAAVSIEPTIKNCLAQLDQQKPLLSRMSGSGGTCFALFENLKLAEKAAEAIAQENQGWWVKAAQILN